MSFLPFQHKKDMVQAAPRSALDREMQTYEVMEDARTEKEIMAWWAANKSALPILASLARSVLCVPASSSKSERIFSKSGLYVTPKRHSLDPDCVSDMVIVSMNL